MMTRTVAVEHLAEASVEEPSLPDLIQYIQEHLGGPPSGAEFVIFNRGEVLGLRYIPYDWESTAYVQDVISFLSDRHI